jgi:hypothetical protein
MTRPSAPTRPYQRHHRAKCACCPGGPYGTYPWGRKSVLSRCNGLMATEGTSFGLGPPRLRSCRQLLAVGARRTVGTVHRAAVATAGRCVRLPGAPWQATDPSRSWIGSTSGAEIAARIPVGLHRLVLATRHAHGRQVVREVGLQPRQGQLCAQPIPRNRLRVTTARKPKRNTNPTTTTTTSIVLRLLTTLPPTGVGPAYHPPAESRRSSSTLTQSKDVEHLEAGRGRFVVLPVPSLGDQPCDQWMQGAQLTTLQWTDGSSLSRIPWVQQWWARTTARRAGPDRFARRGQRLLRLVEAGRHGPILDRGACRRVSLSMRTLEPVERPTNCASYVSPSLRAPVGIARCR